MEFGKTIAPHYLPGMIDVIARTPACRVIDEDGVVLFEGRSLADARVHSYRLLLLGVYDRLRIVDPRGAGDVVYVSRTEAHRWWRAVRDRKQVARLRASAERAARDGVVTLRRQRAERTANGVTGLLTVAIVMLAFDTLLRIVG